jgi:hypothetical protein
MNKFMTLLACLVVGYSAHLANIDPSFRDNFGQIAYLYLCAWVKGKDVNNSRDRQQKQDSKNDESSKK